ncbi:MAG: histidine kinase [candidate division KSB1 bacterium]|nr:histidine kinase [candidate division KSB1 bacterium]
MNRIKQSILILILIFFFFWAGGCISSFAQKLPFKNYSTKDGLVHNEILYLWQDSNGYLWIGTAEGISRFDGANFTNYVLKDTSTSERIDPVITYVNTIFEDRDQNIWIGLNYWGDVARFIRRDQSFVRYTVIPTRPLAPTWVNTIIQDRDGTLWFGTDDGLFIFENDAFHPFLFDSTNSSTPIRVLYEDHQGALWIATHCGLYRYHKNESRVQLLQFPNIVISQCNALYEDNDGNLWIGTDDIGLIKLENYRIRNRPPFQLKAYTVANGLPSNSVHKILQDDFGTLWIATWAGLCQFKPDTEELITYNTTNGLPSDNLRDMLQDREGNLWLATNNGISKLTSDAFVNYGKNDGLPTEALTQIAGGARGEMWIVGFGGASRCIKDTFVSIKPLEGRDIYSVIVDNSGIVWFGTTKGLLKWKGGKILSHFTRTNGLPDDQIHSIFEDSRGRLWFGHEKGVSRLWQGKFRHFYGQIENPLVIGMTEDKDGTIWFATYRDGMYKLTAAPESDINWSKVDLPIGFRTRAILCDRDNKIWIGTRFQGVFRYDPQTGALSNYTSDNGFSSNFIRSIFQDSKGKLWFGTAQGVNYLDGNSFRGYSTRDGLAGDAVMSFFEDRQGFLWFATSTGLSRYNPARDRVVTTPPPVYITHFRILGQEVSPKNGMRLTASQRSVSFEYVGISFKDETQVHYQYRLQGFAPNWSEITERRYVNYTNLHPGNYIFEVRARNADGVWSDQPATLNFHIATPIWQRWWFISLAIMALGSVAFGWHRYRLNKLLELERMRSRIATDLHDEVGSTLSSVALFSEMARREAQTIAPKIAERLQNISEIARELMETIRDIVWSIDPSRDSLEHVVLYMKQYVAEVLEAKGILFDFYVPEETKSLRLPMDVRHHFYLIFKEAINNLVRHSNAHQANIRLGFNQHMLILVIQDDGCGFDPAQIASGNGLKNMKNRARLINGVLTIDTAPGNGTEIALKIAFQK